MNRRRWLQWGCAHCALGLATASQAWAQASPGAVSGVAPGADGWSMPGRFSRPDVGSDEGGLWAIMDREETKLRRSPFRIRDEALSAYLTRLTCQLAGSHCADVRVYALRAPFFNASMAPNGMMQVWSGLLLRVDNEAQLVAVLAHEVAHYLQRHTLEQLQNLRSRAGFGVFLSLFGVVGLIGQLANAAGMMAFSRDHERDADRIGLRLMLEHGYEGRESAKVWANLLEELKATPDADPTKNSVLFATHPPSEERRDTLLRLSEAQPEGSGKLGDKALAEVIRPLRGQLLEDEIKRGRPFESVALITRLLSREPGSAELLHFRGESYLKRAVDNDADLAFADFKAAEQTGQALPITHRSLGYLHRQRRDVAAARSSWLAYLDRAPQAPDAELIRQNLQEMPS